MLISRRAVNEYLDRELDSFTWMKDLTRRALMAEIRKLPAPIEFKTSPWLHQLVCFYIGACMPRFLFLLDMGLGKSKLLADVIAYRKAARQLDRALITVPNVVNVDSWVRDLQKHSNLRACAVDVENIEEKWKLLSNPTGDVAIINYAGLHRALTYKAKGKGKKNVMRLDQGKLIELKRTYNLIGMDEVHFLGNPKSTWYEMMQYLCDHADYVYGLTGTLFGHTPEPVWPQFRLVDGGETFGDSRSLFMSAFFSDVNNGFGIEWNYIKSRGRDLNRMLKHRSIRYIDEEVPELDIPKAAPPVIIEVQMEGEQRDHYLRALQGLLDAEGGNPSEIDAPWIRMRQILSGYMEWSDSHGKHRVRFKHNPKLAALESLLGGMGDSKMVICHEYNETGEIICDHLAKLGVGYTWLYGGTKDKVGVKRKFMEDPKCKVFVMSSAAGGTGNDGLQDVAKYMVFFETPTSPTRRRQTEKRIHRPGQKHRTYFYDLVVKKGLERGILASIAEGRDLYESVVNGSRLPTDLIRG